MSNDFPRMVYKVGGPHEIHGGRFDYLIVDDADSLDAALAGGWSMTTDEARTLTLRPVGEPLKLSIKPAILPADDDAAPTRSELEQKANELGIEFSPRLGDARLAERIDAALAKG